MAEREGFEPSGACAPAVFKTAALNHSTIFPFVFDSFALVIYTKCTQFAVFSSHLMKKIANYLFFASKTVLCVIFSLPFITVRYSQIFDQFDYKFIVRRVEQQHRCHVTDDSLFCFYRRQRFQCQFFGRFGIIHFHS